MIKQINFEKVSKSLGRNGIFKTVGVVMIAYPRLLEDNSSITVLNITPINSRKEVASCWIEIPKENIPQLIQDLQELYDQKTIVQ